jgi:nitrite reductase/ring-hydroxylating ferredoxin subunit
MKSLQDFNKMFPNEEACINYLKEKRFKKGLYCPHCGGKHIYEFSNGKTYKCSACRNKFNIRTGEIMDIKQTKEDWSEYTLENGTVIKIKQVVVQIIKLDETDEQGNPSYVTQTQPIVSVIHSKG